MENVVSSKEVLDLRKKEMLHKKWNDRVYEPLREKIIDVMDGEDWPELDRRKRELHKQYLEFVNEKVGTWVFSFKKIYNLVCTGMYWTSLSLFRYTLSL